MKRFLIAVILCIFTAIPAMALDGEVFINKTLSVGSDTIGTAYAATTSLSHSEGKYRPYVKGEVRFLSGFEILSKKGKAGIAVDITDTITGNVGYELEMFPDESEKTTVSIGTDIKLGAGFTGRIGYNIKEYPDSTEEELYSFGIGYKFQL